jgi:hypothetical protein
MEGFILVEGKGLDQDRLRSLSLRNAKQIVIGSAPGPVPGGTSVILHLAGVSPTDFGTALVEFAQVSNVSQVLPMLVRTPHHA